MEKEFNWFVLASASPRRKQLLKKLVKNFKVIPSTIDEKGIKGRSPYEIAVNIALAKALDVAMGCQKSIVIGADTMVVLKNKILGKPRSKLAAIKMLKSLSGSKHSVITGLAIVDTRLMRIFVAFDETKVTMRKIDDQAIKDYVNTGSPMDKAGGYGVQEIEDQFVKKIDGEYDNVVGLPVKLLGKMLRRIK